jgi:uncharacterized protein (TIGR00369 family)
MIVCKCLLGGFNMPQDHITWLQGFLKESYEAPILENFLNLEAVNIAEGKVILTAQTKDEHCNFYGTVHGGTLASISDIAMGISCVTLGKRVVTIDMSISYIKGAPKGCVLKAIGEVVSAGKTIMRASCEIYSGDQLLSRSQASYFVTGEFTEDSHI